MIKEMRLLLLAVCGVTAFVVEQPVARTAEPSSSGLFAALSNKNPKSKLVPTRSKLTPAQRLMQKNLAGKDDVPSEFDKLKDIAYAVGDGLSNLGTATGANKENTKIFDGYTGVDTKVRKSPTQQLLETLSMNKRPDVTPAKVIVEPSPSRSVFDSVKGAIYGTADLASSIGGGGKDETKNAVPPIQRLSNDFKPATKAQLVASRSVRDAISDLESPNPIQRLIAEWKIRDLEFKENARQQKKQVEDGIDKFKDDVYAVGDFLQKTSTEIQALPGRIQKFAEAMVAFFQSIPVVVQETVDTITAIPERVEQKAAAVKTSVEETVDKTIKVVEDVKAIPSKVQQTAENTKQSVNAAVQKVEEVSTSAKVILGLEKPKPRPPRSPPPQPAGASDLVWKVAGSVFTGAGKAFLWVGKGAADLTWQAVSKGAETVKEKASGKIQEVQGKPVVVTPPKATVAPPKVAFVAPPKVTGALAEKIVQEEIMKDEQLDREIAEALQLATEALAEAKAPVAPSKTESPQPEAPVASEKAKVAPSKPETPQPETSVASEKAETQPTSKNSDD